MLVLSRRKTESIIIDGDMIVTVLEIRGDKVRLGVVAPKEKFVCRKEIWEALRGLRSLVILDPAWLRWNDGTVVRLARSIAQEGNYDALPILADALEEASCDNAAILDHCRCCHPGARNSWVVDFILSAS